MNFTPPNNNRSIVDSLFDRVMYFKESRKQGKKIAILLYDTPDASTFRYRVFNIVSALRTSSEWSAVYFYNNEIENIKELLAHANILVLVRLPYTVELEILLSNLNKKNLPIVFDCDDLVFDPKFVPLISNHIQKSIDYYIVYITKRFLTASLADCFITTNRYLKENFINLFHKNCYIIPNTYNKEQLDVSLSCKTTKLDGFSVGYFSGTPTHFNDFMVCSQAINRFLLATQDTKFALCGHMNLPENMLPLEEQGRIIRYPFTDFMTLQNYISTVHLNIAPLEINDFTKCKSELKFFEAALVNVPTCASKSSIFEDCIIDHTTGYLSDESEWLDVLYDVYENYTQSQKIACNAHEYCLRTYSPENLCTTTISVYNAIINDLL